MTTFATGNAGDTTSQTDDPSIPSEVSYFNSYNNSNSINYVSYSGSDAVATIIVPEINDSGEYTGRNEPLELGELQTISYSMHRENSPIRTLGHVNPRGFIKGGRTIAGSLIFTVFREYAFYRLSNYKRFLNRNGFFAPLADMLPPFDIVLTFFDEFGGGSKMKIFGVTIVDEGQTVSVDDLITEQTYTYMARGIQPMTRLVSENEKMGQRTAEEFERDLQVSKNVFGDETITQYSSMFISAANEVEPPSSVPPNVL
jgi:hypothetical protein